MSSQTIPVMNAAPLDDAKNHFNRRSYSEVIFEKEENLNRIFF